MSLCRADTTSQSKGVYLGGVSEARKAGSCVSFPQGDQPLIISWCRIARQRSRGLPAHQDAQRTMNAYERPIGKDAEGFFRCAMQGKLGQTGLDGDSASDLPLTLAAASQRAGDNLPRNHLTACHCRGAALHPGRPHLSRLVWCRLPAGYLAGAWAVSHQVPAIHGPVGVWGRAECFGRKEKLGASSRKLAK